MLKFDICGKIDWANVVEVLWKSSQSMKDNKWTQEEVLLMESLFIN